MPTHQTGEGEKTFNFLEGAGEMGELARTFDWSGTPVGSPDQWSNSLRTTLGIVLHSAFPMFLFWGEDLTCFYNDAFRPSLGVDGKHPAIGKQGRDVWPEIWEFIGPLITQVMTTGEPVWFEDQLVPFYRNGKIENIYWTFSYSPVTGDHDIIEGVIVVCTETTAKVVGMKELTASRERFQNLIAEATVGIIVLTGENLQVDIVNEAYGKLIGRTPQELLGKDLFKVIPEAEGRYRPIIEKVLVTGEPIYLYDQPYLVFAAGDGIEGFLNLVYQPYKETDGTITGVMVLCQDVTEQVNARRRVVRSEQRFRDLVAEATVATAVLTGRKMILEVANEPMLQIWGRDHSVLGMPLIEIMPEIADQSFPRILDHVFSTGKMYSETDSRANLKRHGRMETIYVDFTYKPLRDENGEVMSILIMAVEVTDRVLTRQKLIQSESNLRNTIRTAPVGMCILKGPQFIVEIANDRMIEIWGRPLADLLNRPIFEGLPEARSQGFEQLLETVYTSGEAVAANGLPIILPRGKELAQIYVNFVYEAYREPDGTISGVIAVVNEVTEQVIAHQKIEELVAKRTEELAAANRHLERSNAELSQFAYIASHDLQEPIRKVSIYTQLLENTLGESSNDQSKKYLDKINSASNRMIQLIRDVLAYSELSKTEPKFEHVDLQQILHEVLSEFELLIEQKGARIRCTGLPIIDAIPLQMSQLLGNILSNAIKYAKADTAPIVAITSQTEGNYCHIEVTDNGIGFDPQHAEQIFSIFQRLHRKTEYSGTGIGLALCKKIIENHYGKIYATSEKGQGSTFHILLPVLKAK